MPCALSIIKMREKLYVNMNMFASGELNGFSSEYKKEKTFSFVVFVERQHACYNQKPVYRNKNGNEWARKKSLLLKNT